MIFFLIVLIYAVGIRMGVSADAPYLDTASKLVAYDGRPVAKLSIAKATLPGAKQVFRSEGLCDTICLRDEPPPPDAIGLLEPAMRAGRAIKPTGPPGSGSLPFRGRPRPATRRRPRPHPPDRPGGPDHPGAAVAHQRGAGRGPPPGGLVAVPPS